MLERELETGREALDLFGLVKAVLGGDDRADSLAARYASDPQEFCAASQLDEHWSASREVREAQLRADIQLLNAAIASGEPSDASAALRRERLMAKVAVFAHAFDRSYGTDYTLGLYSDPLQYGVASGQVDSADSARVSPARRTQRALSLAP